MLRVCQLDLLDYEGTSLQTWWHIKSLNTLIKLMNEWSLQQKIKQKNVRMNTEVLFPCVEAVHNITPQLAKTQKWSK